MQFEIRIIYSRKERGYSMQIKKISITLLMMLCLTLTLSACGNTEPNTNNTTKPAGLPKYSIGISMSYENEF